MLTILAFLAAQAAAAGPLDGAWLEIGRHPGMTVAIDEGATTRDGDLVRVRLRMDMAQANAGLRWGVAEMEFNCRSEGLRTVAAREYDASGALLRNVSADELAATPAPSPGDDALESFRAACHRTGWGEEGAAE